MARKMSTRETLLVGALVFAGVIALWYGRGGDADGLVPSEELSAEILGDPPIVDMALLNKGAADYDGKGRSLFKYYTPPPPVRKVPPPVKRDPPPKQPPRTVTPPKPRTAPNPLANKPKPPSVDFTYVGFLGPKDQRIAVFEKDESMMLARVGDEIEEDFRLVEFKYEGVVLGYTDERFRDQTTELEAQATK